MIIKINDDRINTKYLIGYYKSDLPTNNNKYSVIIHMKGPGNKIKITDLSESDADKLINKLDKLLEKYGLDFADIDKDTND